MIIFTNFSTISCFSSSAGLCISVGFYKWVLSTSSGEYLKKTNIWVRDLEVLMMRSESRITRSGNMKGNWKFQKLTPISYVVIVMLISSPRFYVLVSFSLHWLIVIDSPSKLQPTNAASVGLKSCRWQLPSKSWIKQNHVKGNANSWLFELFAHWLVP